MHASSRQFSRLIGCPERHVIWEGAGVPALIGARIDLHASSATRVSELHMHVAETFCLQNRDRLYCSHRVSRAPAKFHHHALLLET